ncbi:tripartite tricarboxylate transporter permease [Bacillus sp. Marseille-P3661]|uniref:tripartite tricarboxylate transporter permease n=1 Tax=Bacillus sp. Marseille-P3661 TaxID=1936234 RepID=UPI000C844937|nr:tripartite tricarboxylate transporter permease [Bacillus sp. Marseille-P3661]
MGIIESSLSELLSFTSIGVILLGSLVGLLIGALPGLGATIAVVLLLPITYTMSPVAAILLLLSAFQAAEYGGSISSIVLGIPGTPAAAATVLDGNALAKKNSPGKALAYSLVASTIGGLIGGLALLTLSGTFSRLALAISVPEYFLIGILGLVAVASLSSKDKMRSSISVILGLMAGTVGMDMFTATSRYTFGHTELIEGLSIIMLLVGMFAFSEVFSMVSNDLNKKYSSNTKGLHTKITISEIKSVGKPIGIGSVIGSIVGIFPGLGTAASSWFSYSLAKKWSKNPEDFGNGNPEGIAAPEAANNATVGGAMVPLLTLGIPGSPGMAIIMGAFIIHGIQPGPKFFADQGHLAYAIIIGFIFTSIAMYFMGRLVTPLFSRVLTIPTTILVPGVVILSILGLYASTQSFFNLWLALFIGIISFILNKLKFSMPSFILAFVLCPIIETNLRRTLILSEGSYGIFFQRFSSIIIMIFIFALILFPIFSKFVKDFKKKNKNKLEYPTT